MGRPCSICVHPKLQEIDRALVEGKQSQRALAREFNITKTAINRHFLHHLPAELAKSQEAKEVIEADNNIDRLLVLQKEVQKILEAAKEARTWHICLEAVREAARLIELSSKISGELRPEFSVILSPQFITIQTAIIEALSPFPEARSKVVEALKRVERYGE